MSDRDNIKHGLAKPPAEDTHWLVRWIFEEARRQGVSDWQLAKDSGVSYHHLHRYWKNQHQPTLRNLEKLIQALDCELQPPRANE